MGLSKRMLLPMSRGVKPGVTGGVNAARGCMPQDAADEVWQWQTQGLWLVGAVVGVWHEHDAIAQAKGPLVWDGPTLGITCQVQDDAPAMLVGGTDLDVEGLAVELLDLALPAAHVGAGWQMQAGQCMPQGVEQLAAEELLQGLDRGKPVGPATAPMALRVDAAGTDQAVDVRVV
jgi:hypothetical protein